MSVTAQNGEDHLKESMQLQAIGYVDLFQIKMMPRGYPDQYLFLTPKKSVTWQGKEWEGVPSALVGFGQNSSGENNRPKFTIVNPNGVFSKYVHQGWTDNAEIIRYRVLRSHLEANLNSFVKHVWRVAKALSVTPGTINLELRSALDGQSFFLPARAFSPPDFPHVSL